MQSVLCVCRFGGDKTQDSPHCPGSLKDYFLYMNDAEIQYFVAILLFGHSIAGRMLSSCFHTPNGINVLTQSLCTFLQCCLCKDKTVLISLPHASAG